jgi:phosphinothricin acetyltransferase
MKTMAAGARMVRIRLASEPDAEALAGIYAPFVEGTATSFETIPPGPDEMRRRVVETTTLYPWLVCEAGGEVVGYAYATQHRVRAAYRWSVDTAVYVAASHHRRGIGRGLYTSLFEVLRAQRFFNAYAGVTLPNAASVGLHEAVDFRRLGVFERVGYKLGRWHDVGWWHLALQKHNGIPDEPLPLSNVTASTVWERMARCGERLIRSAD